MILDSYVPTCDITQMGIRRLRSPPISFFSRRLHDTVSFEIPFIRVSFVIWSQIPSPFHHRVDSELPSHPQLVYFSSTSCKEPLPCHLGFLPCVCLEPCRFLTVHQRPHQSLPYCVNTLCSGLFILLQCSIF